jgi:N-acetylneuraminate lyase
MSEQPSLPEGIYTALVTPFKEDGVSVDYEKIPELVFLLQQQGIAGLYVCGTTGQRTLLSVEERKKIFELVAETVHASGIQTALIVHVGSDDETGSNLEQAIELGCHARDYGATAISAITPKKPETGIVSFYQTLAEFVDHPIIIYNFPKQTGITLEMPVLDELSKINQIRGIKFTNQDFYLLERIGKHIPQWIRFSGTDEAFASSLATGTRRAIGSTYNFMAPLFMRIKTCYEQGNLIEAEELQEKANDVVEALKDLMKLTGNPEGLIAGVKYAVGYLYGIHCGHRTKDNKEPSLNEVQTANLRITLDVIKPYLTLLKA